MDSSEDMRQEYVLPTLYAPWIAQLLDGPIPQETEATCQDCVMCSRQPQQTGDVSFFDPRVKCCTYEPRLANFLAGRVLADGAPGQAEGRATIEARINRRVGVSPLGLDQSARYGLLYKNAVNAFGRAPALRCPHYVDTQDGGQCGIWAYRPAVCATWFCKHVRGAVGREFWRRLAELLGALETELSVWCAVELGAASNELVQLGESGTNRLDVAELDGPVNMDLYRRIWGVWAGKEAEYYRACARLVEVLDWKEVAGISGSSVRLLSQLVREAHHKLTSDGMPDRLRVGNFRIEGVVEGKFRVISYSGYDPLLMSERLARALPNFAGQPREEAVKTVEEKLNLKLPRQLLRRLMDFGVLVACEKTPE